MKVGKEEIVGLLVALQRYVREDHDAIRAGWVDKLEAIRTKLRGVDGLSITIVQTPAAGMAVPYALVELDEHTLGLTAYELLRRLQECDPPVYLNEELAWQGAVTINPMTLRDGDEMVVAREVALIVSGQAVGNPIGGRP